MDIFQISALSSMAVTIILYNTVIYNNFKINKKLDKILEKK